MEYNLTDLKRETNKRRESTKRLFRERYKLAKELGFSAAEAQVLSQKPEELIRKLAKELDSNA